MRAELDRLPAEERAMSTLINSVARLLYDQGELAAAEARAQERAENPAPAPAYYTVVDVGTKTPSDPAAVAARAARVTGRGAAR